MKSMFTFQRKKRLIFTTVKSPKPAATFWIFLLRSKTDNYVVWRWKYTLLCQKDESRLQKKKNHLHFRRNFSANHNQAHPNLNQKRTNQVQIWTKRIRFILADDLSHIKNFYIIFFSFNLHSTSHFYSTYRKSWSSRSPMTEFSGLSTLIPTLLLLQ